MALALAYETCVRTRSGAATCRACVDACPAEAIDLAGSVVVDLERCTACGLCQAECPSDAFSGAFDAAAFVRGAGPVVRCGDEGLPCVGAVSAEDLVVLALRHGSLTVEARRCASATTGHLLAAAHVDEAQRWLTVLGARGRVSFIAAPPPKPDAARASSERAASPARRRLLRLFVAGPSRLVRGELEQGELQRPPQSARRKRLLAAFDAAFEVPDAPVPARELAFTSGKTFDEAKCTGCRACVDVCPTGALGVTARAETLRFDASRCVACGACHEVCEPRALLPAVTFSPADFFELAPRALGRCTPREAPHEAE